MSKFDLTEVEAFLYREARLLDEGEYQEWLALWDADALYVVPGNVDDPDPTRHASIIYLTRPGIEDRVARLCHDGMYAQEPRSRTVRMVSNVEARDDGENRLVVRSNVMVVEVRRATTRVLAATSHHTLDTAGDAPLIREKRVLLADRETAMPPFTFLM